MPVACLVRGIGGELRDGNRPFDAPALGIVNRDAVAPDVRNITFLQENKPLGHRQERENIGGDERFSDT